MELVRDARLCHTGCVMCCPDLPAQGILEGMYVW